MLKLNNISYIRFLIQNENERLKDHKTLVNSESSSSDEEIAELDIQLSPHQHVQDLDIVGLENQRWSSASDESVDSNSVPHLDSVDLFEIQRQNLNEGDGAELNNNARDEEPIQDPIQEPEEEHEHIDVNKATNEHRGPHALINGMYLDVLQISSDRVKSNGRLDDRVYGLFPG